MEKEMLNTKEVAEYLGIHEKQVYALIKAKKIPCTRVTGKWLFPRDLISQWIVDNARLKNKSHPSGKREAEGALLAAGSNDPILDILLSMMILKFPELHLFSSSIGSTSGLRLLSEGVTDIAWCHLGDPVSGKYDSNQISSYFPETDVTIVHLFHRELGILLSEKPRKKITGLNDLPGSGVRIINRQEGSGTRKYLDYRLSESGISGSDIPGYDDVVNTHFEVGLRILSGRADAGIATIAASRLLGLSFIPLVNESFDMVIKQSTFFLKNVQNLISMLKSKEFRESVMPLGNYDFSNSGDIVYSSTDKA